MYRASIVASFDYRDLARNRQLLNRLEEFYFDSVSRIRLPLWSKGRVALLGDAASCVSFLGGGSSNAIAGAAVLTEALSSMPDQPETAFRGYERLHQKLVDSTQRWVRLASSFLIPSTSAGICIRNLAIGFWHAASAR
jgi:2-polyprenyl-6-methoxyphenol hydroxylase-like FAD-dependent oxidoreductase